MPRRRCWAAICPAAASAGCRQLPAALALVEQACGELQGLGAARLLIRAGAGVLVGAQAVGQHVRRQAQAQVVGVLRTGGTRTHNVGNGLPQGVPASGMCEGWRWGISGSGGSAAAQHHSCTGLDSWSPRARSCMLPQFSAANSQLQLMCQSERRWWRHTMLLQQQGQVQGSRVNMTCQSSAIPHHAHPMSCSSHAAMASRKRDWWRPLATAATASAARRASRHQCMASRPTAKGTAPSSWPSWHTRLQGVVGRGW